MLSTSFGYLILLIVPCASEDTEAPFVKTNMGTIKGLKASDGNYFMYLGIPYATVDTNNPFSSSVPSLAFKEVFEAYNDTFTCPHTHKKNNTLVGSLDCLRLNIYIPESNSLDQRFPVMVWIHGGSFKYGHGGRKIFGPSYLVQHDVILVTFNYRTGPYGFMCLDIPEISGNQGLKDQYLALRWIKDNIETFGGNANKITIFGEGAGAHSIDLHLMSTKEILYNSVILQSGSAQCPSVLQEPDKLAPLKMARYLGFNTSNMKDALNFLSKSNMKAVLNAANSLNIQFKPCVESLFDNVDPFIAHSWLETKVPKIKNMSVLMGFNQHELARSLLSRDIKHFNVATMVRDNLQHSFYFPEQVLAELTDLVARFYFVDEGNLGKLAWQLIRFVSDFNYIHPIHRTLQKYLDSEAGNVYLYMFSYVIKRNIQGRKKARSNDESENRLCCASHADELAYLFKKETNIDLNRADEIVMQRMTTMWTNFVKYGNPTPTVSELLPVQWQAIELNKYYYLNIGTNLTLGQRPLHARMAFWDLFYRQHKTFQQGYEEEEQE